MSVVLSQQSLPVIPTDNQIGGFPSDLFVGPLDPEFLCSICQDVLRDPMEAYNAGAGPSENNADPCCHLFCKECISEWLKTKQSCPQCRKPLRNEHLHRAVRLQRKIWQLQIRCRYSAEVAAAQHTRSSVDPAHGRSCTAVGVLGKDANWWSVHEAAACQMVPVPCIHCRSHISRGEIENHKQNDCAFRPIPCNYCFAQVRITIMDKHLSEQCPKVLVPCPNGCLQPDATPNVQTTAAANSPSSPPPHIKPVRSPSFGENPGPAPEDQPNAELEKPVVQRGRSEPGAGPDQSPVASEKKESAFAVQQPPPNDPRLWIQREQLAFHQQHECPLSIVPCGYSVLGCDATMRRSELEKHLQQAAVMHMNLTLHSMEILMQECLILRSGLSAMQTHASGVQKFVGIPEASLAPIRPLPPRPALLLRAASKAQTAQSKSPGVLSSPTASGSSAVALTASPGSGGGPVESPDPSYSAALASAGDVKSAETGVMEASRVDTLEEMLHIPGRIEWTVFQWSKQPTNTRLCSPYLTRSGKKWRGTVEKKDDGAVSIFLRYEDGPRPLFVRLVLMVLSNDDRDTPAVTSSLTHTYLPLSEGGYQGWGCNRFCSLDELMQKGGYKAEQDSVTFRIEFTVDNKRLKLEQDVAMLCRRIDLLEKRGNLPGSIEWTLRNWSNLPSEVSFFSPVMMRNGQRWRGSVEQKRSGHVSVYLRYEKGFRPLKVDFKLMLLTPEGLPAISRELSYLYEHFDDGGYTGWGYHKFCTIEELRQKGAYNAEQDSITVRIEFSCEEMPARSATVVSPSPAVARAVSPPPPGMYGGRSETPPPVQDA